MARSVWSDEDTLYDTALSDKFSTTSVNVALLRFNSLSATFASFVFFSYAIAGVETAACNCMRPAPPRRGVYGRFCCNCLLSGPISVTAFDVLISKFFAIVTRAVPVKLKSRSTRSRTRAAPPATCGAAIDVPLIKPYWLSFNVEKICPPGAEISGLKSRFGVMPHDVKFES